jgi:hypothetical protein
MSTTDDEAVNLLGELREGLATARKMAAEDPDPGLPGAVAIAVRVPLRSIDALRGFGAGWLRRQPDDVQKEVDDAEKELLTMRARAIIDGAADLPKDVPTDPFDT